MEYNASVANPALLEIDSECLLQTSDNCLALNIKHYNLSILFKSFAT